MLTDPVQATLLLSGSFDSSIGLSDVRTTSQCIKWKVDSEVEVGLQFIINTKVLTY